MSAYYNEFEPFAAEWLRNLIKAGLIADGDVDTRSIVDVLPSDIMGYDQCHFFAGIGVWSYALRLSGWGDGRKVWTGSCPCQPFSSAGKGEGFADERHLWPYWHHLVRVCKPPVIFGEQVASKDGLTWLDLVQSDLEGEGYCCGAQDICAAGVGAPHIRQRLWFVADSEIAIRRRTGGETDDGRRIEEIGRPSSSYVLEHSNLPIANRRASIGEQSLCHTRANLGVTQGDANISGPQGRDLRSEQSSSERPTGEAGLVNGFWSNAEWIWCRDEKLRPIEPGIFPLANGVAQRMGRLRGYGNAINPEVAKVVIQAYMECRP